MNDAIITKKSLGQHWLHDKKMLNAMANAAEAGPGDIVLEVGSGLGTLTAVLCEKATKVVAVEFDEVLARELPYRVPDENLEVVQQDILSFDLTQLPKNYKVAANIPYYLTAKLVRMLLESYNPPYLTALLVQKEVAQRLAASPGELSILGVSAQFYANVELKEVVPAELFSPPPKVDSQIVVLKRRDEPLFKDILPEEYFKIVRAGFSEKRKKLRSSLSGGLRFSKQEVDDWLKKANIDSNARAQQLSLDDWYKLVKLL